MRAFISAAGIVFGLIVVAHLWRAVAEGPQVFADPWYIGLTVAAAGLGGWAWRVLRSLPRSSDTK